MPSGELIRHMVGRDVTDLYPRSSRQFGETLLELTNLTGVTKPDSVSFSVRAGEVLGLFGLVGAGRTETLRALFGLDPVVRGKVSIAGTEKTRSSPRARWTDGMALLSEDRKREGLFLGRSLREACRGWYFALLLEAGAEHLQLPVAEPVMSEHGDPTLVGVCRAGSKRSLAFVPGSPDAKQA